MDIARTKQAAVYLASNVADLYVVKLMKLFYYLDFIAVRETGRPVTNDTYFNLPFGPIPSFIKDNIDSLDERIKTEQRKVFNPDSSSTPEWLKLSSIFDNVLKIEAKGKGSVVKVVSEYIDQTDKLSAYEHELLADIVKDLGAKTVQQIVTDTHAEPPYSQTTPSQEIPYELAFQLDVKKILPSRKVEFDKEIAFSRFISS